MTTTTEGRTTKLADLERRRGALALDVREGRRGAARELDQVEAEIATLRRDEEREALADRARTDRDAAAAVERAAERKRTLEGRFGELLPQREAAAHAVDQAADGLVAAVKSLTELGKQMYDVSVGLGAPRHRLLLDETIANYVRWRLSEALRDFPRPDRLYRRSLREIVGGERQVKS